MGWIQSNSIEKAQKSYHLKTKNILLFFFNQYIQNQVITWSFIIDYWY